MRETFPDQMADSFPGYLGVLKHADRISAISGSTARELAGFADMLSAQGRSGADVRVHALPVEPLATSERDLAATAELLGLGAEPLVLVVGSHEPRKNHVVVLLAAERLWRSGLRFDLAFLGASAWRTESFEQLADRLHRAGRPVKVLRRVPEPTLWASYRLATVTVFPSLAEGFGLPVAESLACGTPVITSDFGSMAELAAGGGVIGVDPRDAAAVQAALALLLSDGVRWTHCGARPAAAAGLAGTLRRQDLGLPGWPVSATRRLRPSRVEVVDDDDSRPARQCGRPPAFCPAGRRHRRQLGLLRQCCAGRDQDGLSRLSVSGPTPTTTIRTG